MTGSEEKKKKLGKATIGHIPVAVSPPKTYSVLFPEAKPQAEVGRGRVKPPNVPVRSDHSNVTSSSR